MGFCENNGQLVDIKGVNADKRVSICKKCIGTVGTKTDGNPVNYCSFNSIFDARSNCEGFKEHVEGGMETVTVQWVEYT